MALEYQTNTKHGSKDKEPPAEIEVAGADNVYMQSMHQSKVRTIPYIRNSPLMMKDLPPSQSDQQ